MAAPISPALYDQFARGWRGYALVALIAALSGFFGLFGVPVLDSEESHFVLGTRAFLDAPNLAADAFGARALQAFAVRLLSPEHLNAVWAYRAPSVLGLVLAALACLWGGKALTGGRAAFYGAALFAVGLLSGFAGMMAAPTALLLGFTTTALAALAHVYAGKSGRLIALTFWIAFACAFCIDALAPSLAIFVTVVSLCFWERRVRWLSGLLPLPGVLAGLAVIAVAAESGARFSTAVQIFDSDHLGLPGYHLLLLPLLIFPATYALPAAARIAFAALRAPRRIEAPERFLVAWAIALFATFELLPTKLPHYALLAYPAVALLCGAGLAAMPFKAWRSTHPAGVVIFAVAGAALAVVLGIGATFMPGDLGSDLRRALSAGLLGAVVIAAAIAALLTWRRPAARAAVLIATGLVFSYSLRAHILPDARALNVSGETVAALRRAELIPRSAHTLWVVGYPEASMALLTRNAAHFADAEAAGAAAHREDAIVVEGRELAALQTALNARRLMLAEKDAPVAGLALSNGRRVTMIVGEVAPLSAAADDRRRNP